MIFKLVTQSGQAHTLRGIDLYSTLRAAGVAEPVVQLTIEPESDDAGILSLLERLILAERALERIILAARQRNWDV